MRARVAHGKQVVTLDGLPTAERRQIAACFAATAGLQCGFCLPGIALRAKSITDRDPAPTRQAIAHALDGHLCRCTGNLKIIDAIELLAVAKCGEPIPPACTDGRVGQPMARIGAEGRARPLGDALAQRAARRQHLHHRPGAGKGDRHLQEARSDQR